MEGGKSLKDKPGIRMFVGPARWWLSAEGGARKVRLLRPGSYVKFVFANFRDGISLNQDAGCPPVGRKTSRVSVLRLLRGDTRVAEWEGVIQRQHLPVNTCQDTLHGRIGGGAC